VTRAATAATLALALAAVALAPGLAPTAPGSRAAAADCAWQRQTKRIVHHVRRHGRPRRLVRVTHPWACVPLPAPPGAVATTPAPAPPPTPPPAEAPPPAAEVGRLSVKAEEFSFTLSRPDVAAGETIVELNNQGGDPHNLNLQREGGEEPPLAISEAGPAEHRSGRFTLAPGTYRLWCSLPEHDEKGMHATLVVDPG